MDKGMSYRAICEALRKAGHKPQGKCWYPKTIGSISGFEEYS